MKYIFFSLLLFFSCLNFKNSDASTISAETFFLTLYNANKKGPILKDYFQRCLPSRPNARPWRKLLGYATELANTDPVRLAFYSHIIGSEKEYSLVYFLFNQLAREYKTNKTINFQERGGLKKDAQLLSIPLSLIKPELVPENAMHYLSQLEPATIWRKESEDTQDINNLYKIFPNASQQQKRTYDDMIKNHLRRTVEGLPVEELYIAPKQSIGKTRNRGSVHPGKQQREKTEKDRGQGSLPRTLTAEALNRRARAEIRARNKDLHYYYLNDHKVQYLLAAGVSLAVIIYMYRNPNNVLVQKVIKPLAERIANSPIINNPLIRSAVQRLNTIGMWLRYRSQQ